MIAKRKKNNKRNKQQFENFDEDSDGTFAYIAGYTIGGAPYGITWEEWEFDEEENMKPDNPSPNLDDLPF